jgi:sterol desaturase/sphingolipid hydroxylase (fatty acid hydroxylase superfamily)
MKFPRSTGAGLLSFYGLCAISALVIYTLQVDPIRAPIDLLAANADKSYAESLKFRGLIFIALAVAIELVVLRLQHKKNRYDAGDSGSSLLIYLFNTLIGPLTIIYMYGLLKFVEQFAFIELGDGILPLLITVFLFEGAYYWYHRLSHEIPFLWSIHHTHHSAQTLNLSIAFRLHPFGRLVSPFIYVPMILVGFKPEYILVGLSVSLLYQFFIHTETVPKMGVLEHIGFNTPSKHRVHHGTNEYCIDKNYGGMLIVWDQIYGTYTPEDEPVRYGVTSGFYSYNPVKIMFGPQRDWLKGEFHREREELDKRLSAENQM